MWCEGWRQRPLKVISIDDKDGENNDDDDNVYGTWRNVAWNSEEGGAVGRVYDINHALHFWFRY